MHLHTDKGDDDLGITCGNWSSRYKTTTTPRLCALFIGFLSGLLPVLCCNSIENDYFYSVLFSLKCTIMKSLLRYFSSATSLLTSFDQFMPFIGHVPISIDVNVDPFR